MLFTFATSCHDHGHVWVGSTRSRI